MTSGAAFATVSEAVAGPGPSVAALGPGCSCGAWVSGHDRSHLVGIRGSWWAKFRYCC